jgi:hypothetical protein
MINSLHDYILIAIAVLYTLVFLARVALAGRGGQSGTLWINIPAWIATAALLTALLW